MAKDEDVCLHCGLCAERCPTGAWDMERFPDRRGTGGARMLQQVDRVAQGVTGLQRVNDFVVKFANVNGSGSASANSMFAKGRVCAWGVASTPRNIFS